MIPTDTNGFPSKRPVHLSARKKVLFYSILIVAMWLFVEALTAAAYSLYKGQILSLEEFHIEREELIEHLASPEGIGGQVHPYVGYVEEPPVVGGVGPAGEPLTFRVSEFGYVDTISPIQKKSPDKVVVGVLGGSVASYFARYGVGAVERELRRVEPFARKEFVFVNLALGGYKQPQQLMTLNYLLALGAEFDILVNIDGFNEVALHAAENGTKGVSPVFPRAWFSRVGFRDPEMLRLVGKWAYSGEERAELAQRHQRFPLRYSPVANMVWKVLNRVENAKAARVFKQFSSASGKTLGYAATGPAWEFPKREAVYEHLASIWKNSSVQLDRLSKANDIRYYHFLQPNQYVSGSKLIGPVERQLAFQVDHPYKEGVESGYPLLRQKGLELKREGINFVDLTGIYREHSEPIYIDSCCHVNGRGNVIMGAHVAEAIRADYGRTD